MVVFVLFFGLPMLEAIASRAWIRVLFWMAMAILFLALSLRGSTRNAQRRARV
jgi:hypothetical protein